MSAPITPYRAKEDWSTQITRLITSTQMFKAPLWDEVKDDARVQVNITAGEYRAIQQARKALGGE